VIAVTGAGHVLLREGDDPCDPLPYLKTRKSRKYMGIQDDLAVVSAGKALAAAGLDGQALGERTGLYLAVGYIPFQEEDIGPVLAASLDAEGRFSMERFSDVGYQQAHPLLTFRCLPNMPAYHVSVNFDIQGPYLVTYPGAAQLYLAIEEACAALREGRVDVALVGGVAHQRNFLVEHHFRRIDHPREPAELRDAGAFLVLETKAHAAARGATPLGCLKSLSLHYTPFDPIEAMPAPSEMLEILAADQADDDDEPAPMSSHSVASPSLEFGPASLAITLSTMWGDRGIRDTVVRHILESRDGLRGESTWLGGRAEAP